VEHSRLEVGDRLEPLCVNASPHAPLQRRGRVLAEVEAVAAVDRLEEERDLDLLDVARLQHVYW
jgi:hypothetical protein